VPPEVVTWRWPVVAPAGTATVIPVAPLRVTLEAGTPLRVTRATLRKSVPVRGSVSSTPPVRRPPAKRRGAYGRGLIAKTIVREYPR